MIRNFPFAFFGIPFDEVAIWAMVLITIYSGYDYFSKNRNVIQYS